VRLETTTGRGLGTLLKARPEPRSKWAQEQYNLHRPNTSRLGPRPCLKARLKTLIPPREIHRIRTVLLKYPPKEIAQRYGVPVEYIEKLRWGQVPVGYRQWLGEYKRHTWRKPSIVHCKRALGQTAEVFARVVNHFLSSEYDVALGMLGR